MVLRWYVAINRAILPLIIESLKLQLYSRVISPDGIAIADNLWLIGEDKTLNPKQYFIIVVALFGNGQSSSPSNQPSPKPFPKVSFYDNVRAQYELVTKHFGITHLRAVVGWSMGAGQTFQWATQYPDFMDIAVPFCGSAKTSLHNKVFLEGVKAALLAVKNTRSAGSGNGAIQEDSAEVRTWSERDREVGLKAMGRVYAGWWVNAPALACFRCSLTEFE